MSLAPLFLTIPYFDISGVLKPLNKSKQSQTNLSHVHREFELVQDYKHKSLLTLIRKIVDVPAGYSKEDLVTFRSIASRQYPALVPIMDEYLRLAEKSDTELFHEGSQSKTKATR